MTLGPPFPVHVTQREVVDKTAAALFQFAFILYQAALDKTVLLINSQCALRALAAL